MSANQDEESPAKRIRASTSGYNVFRPARAASSGQGSTFKNPSAGNQALTGASAARLPTSISDL